MVSDKAFDTIMDAVHMVMQRADAAEAETVRLNQLIEEMRQATGRDTLERDVVTGHLELAPQILKKVYDLHMKNIGGCVCRDEISKFLAALKQDHPQLHLTH